MDRSNYVPPRRKPVANLHRQNHSQSSSSYISHLHQSPSIEDSAQFSSDSGQPEHPAALGVDNLSGEQKNFSLPVELWQRGPNEPSAALSRSAYGNNNPFSYNEINRSRARSSLSTSRSSYTPGLLAEALTEQESSTHTSVSTCESCCICKPDTSYCNVCQYTFCPECWAAQMTHRNNRIAPGNVPHERTSRELALQINNILDPDLSIDSQNDMHAADQCSTWFGVTREPGELPIFQDYGRYANLMSDTGPRGNFEHHDVRYPGLVSFVGQSGAGKSTLIKFIIDLSTDEPGSFETPIVGSVKNQDLPTSTDVHLYPDPNSISSITPILYADCEGLKGGEREPISLRFKKKQKGNNGGQGSSFEKSTERTLHTSEREITWADNPTKRSREFAVTHLYPRLLYTFSDVIVFVLKNPRTVEDVFEKLLDWAAAALEKSSNQPVLPHAIIILNAAENNTPTELWDPEVATTKLMDSLSNTVFSNAKFKEYANFWRYRQRQIDSLGELLLSYYSSIKVLRIPTHGRPNLISEQVLKLYTCIQTACTDARMRKGELRMLLGADELQSYLQYAFDHFACDLDSPFDFVQASFVNSPIPSDFGGNILKLAIIMMEVWRDYAPGSVILKELSYMVASCIMLDSARHGIKGGAAQIFPQYVEHLDAALENFCDRHWPCEFKSSSGARCVNVRSGHGSKGHQQRNGKVLAVGAYFSEFSFENYQRKYQEDVFVTLDGLLQMLRQKQAESNMTEEQAAAKIHQDEVMRNFFSHAVRNQPDALKFVSHTACFCCLFEAAEHCLPCGHVLCTHCLRSFGISRQKNVYEIICCPFDGKDFPRGTWTIVLKPKTSGVRILTLDGGGIRGIVELEILRLIELQLGGIPIRSFLDLVVGTSTGGIIALGLVANDWSVNHCTQTFEDLCRKAFTARTGSNIPGVGFLVKAHHHSKYETQPLQEALVAAFEEHYLFGGERQRKSLLSLETKVAVTSTSTAGNPMVLASYNRRSREKVTYHFQRPEKLALELKTWEAARATSAAPKIFKPMVHEPSKQVYADGAIYHNNPIQIADQERKLLWPHLIDYPPDIVLSIGTSYSPESAQGKNIPKSPTLRLGLINYAKTLKKIAEDHIASSLNSEKTWETYLEILNPMSQDLQRYVRLNPKLTDRDPPPLDGVDQLNELKSITRTLMQRDDRIKKLALQLIATSFYFEKVGQLEPLPTGGFEIKGHIHCRLLDHSSDMSRLGKLLKDLSVKYPPYFVIQEEHHSRGAAKRPIPYEDLENMITFCRFKMKISVKLESRLSKTEILLCLNSKDLFHLSHFPRSLVQDDNYNTGKRNTIAANSSRWAGRSQNRGNRNSWTPPPQQSSEFLSDVIKTYSNPKYMLDNISEITRVRDIRPMLSSQTTPSFIAYELDDSSAMIYELMDTSIPSELPTSSRAQREADSFDESNMPRDLNEGFT